MSEPALPARRTSALAVVLLAGMHTGGVYMEACNGCGFALPGLRERRERNNMKALRKKAAGIGFALAVIVGMAVSNGSVKVQAEELPAAETISGNGWTLDADGVFTLTQDITREMLHNNPDWHPYAEQIKEIIVAEGVTSIPQAFLSQGVEYPNLRKLTLSSTVKSIGIGAFDGLCCPALAEVHLNEGLEVIEHGAFAKTAISEIHFPSTLKYIGGDSFYDCDNLTSVTIPGNVEAFEINGEFYDCNNLEEFIIEEGNLKVFSPSVLGACHLKYVWIPKTVETIENVGSFFDACVIGYKGTAAEAYFDKTKFAEFYNVIFHAIDGDQHSYGEWQTVTEATCTENGLQKHACTICRAEETREIPALEHTWDEGKVTLQATLQNEGVKTYTCTVCGAEKTEAIPKSTPTLTPVQKPETAPTVVPETNIKPETNNQAAVQKPAASPKTGENTTGAAWLLLAAASVGAVSVLHVKRRAVK